MLDENKKEIIAREIIVLSGITILAFLFDLSGPLRGVPFWLLLGGLYLSRWLFWALSRANKRLLKESGFLLLFPLGAVLIAMFLLQVMGFCTILVERQQPGSDALLALAIALIFGLPGFILVRSAIRRSRANRDTESESQAEE